MPTTTGKFGAMRPLVYALSDSVGETAEMVVKAAVSQFGTQNLDIRRIGQVSTKEKIGEIFEEIKAHGRTSLVCYTIVTQDLREEIVRQGKMLSIPTVDLLGGVLQAVADFSGLTPHLKPGLMHQLDEEYFKRVAAVEFAVKYDDGKDPTGITTADIVLVGVSRTSKTPLSMFLAHKRIKVANVPLVPEFPPPPELFTVPSRKILGLIIDPFKLNEIRHERLKVMGIEEDANYASVERIEEELAYALGIMRKLHCLVLDVSNKAIEETANIVIDVHRKNNAEFERTSKLPNASLDVE